MKSKRPQAAPAADLYTSPLFAGRRAYVEQTCDRWFVLSAKHGLLRPDEVVAPYDVALTDQPAPARAAWSRRVLDALRDELGSLAGHEFEIHAGAAYRDSGLVAGLRRAGAVVVNPTDGLNQGQQLAFYGRHRDGRPRPASTSSREPAPRATNVPPLPLPAPPVDHVRLGEVRDLGGFTFRWPDATEWFSRGWEFDATAFGRTFRIRHGVGRHHVFGRDRRHSVTWVNGAPAVEGAEAEDYLHSRALVSVLKRPDGRDARSLGEVAPHYRGFDVVVHRDAIHGPNARHGLAVKIRVDDLEAWARYALLRWRDRQAPRPMEPAAVAPPATAAPDPSPATVERPGPPPARAAPTVPVPPDVDAVVAALLAHAEALAREPGPFTPDLQADAFVRADPFALLVAVVCDQGIRAERAWAAPLRLRERLGHWDLERIAAEPEAVTSAFKQRPALHRMVEIMPARVSRAARKVLDEYGGDAARIWNDHPSAAELARRLEAFDGIGQKKAAMAVEILERDLGVLIGELHGSDIAYDVHVRRVFLRSGIAERDDPAHMVARARQLHPERPGELDLPAWDIGRTWCRPTNPLCDVCPLGGPCPRRVAAAAGVDGM